MSIPISHEILERAAANPLNASDSWLTTGGAATDALRPLDAAVAPETEPAVNLWNAAGFTLLKP